MLLSSSRTSLLPLLSIFSLVLLCLSTLVASKGSSTGNRLLVVLDSASSKKTYSTFFDDLEQRGYQISFRGSKEVSPQLYSHEEREFDQLLLMAPTAKSLPSDLSPQSLVSFLKGGGNMVISVSPSLTESYRDLAREFSLELSERGSTLIDHFRYSTNNDESKDHSSVLLGPSSDLSGSGLSSGGILVNEAIFSRETLALSTTLPILYKGLTHRVGALPLAFPILKAPGTSYSGEAPKENGQISPILDEASPEVPVLGGEEDVSLISGFQLRDNSARVAWVGSLDMFSNDFLNAKKVKSADGAIYPSTLNGPLLRDLTSWTFQERGVLKVSSTHHDRIRTAKDDVREPYEEEGSGKMYRVKDGVTFTMDLSTFDSEAGWIAAPTDLDLQVSLVMLDPYITTSLSASPTENELTTLESDALSSLPAVTNTTTRYSASFKLPDRHGVFTFSVKWSRNGWSYVSTKDTAPVRPFNHDEHPRWLSSAHPYYAGAWSTVVAFLVFSTIWIMTAEKEMKGEGKKAK